MIELEPIKRLTRDLKVAAVTLSEREARYLVDLYYQMQDGRMRAANQERTLAEGAEPHTVIGWARDQFEAIERGIKSSLDAYSMGHPMGRRMRGVVGVGPVIAAGLLAHIDIRRAKTAGDIWRLAGYDPTSKWEKGQKRPWNAALKVVCFHLGESFVKVHNKERDVYGKIYAARKALEITRNDKGEYAEQAASGAKRVNRSTESYKHYAAGKLPPGHIHARAKRYAVKMFLSHLHENWYQHEFGTAPPKPFILNIPPHSHYVAPEW